MAEPRTSAHASGGNLFFLISISTGAAAFLLDRTSHDHWVILLLMLLLGASFIGLSGMGTALGIISLFEIAMSGGKVRGYVCAVMALLSNGFIFGLLLVASFTNPSAPAKPG